MRLSVVWGIAVVLTAGCASSPQQQASNPNQVVCKRERTTGSHTSRQVCRTVAEAEESRQKARASMEHRRSLNTEGGQ